MRDKHATSVPAEAASRYQIAICPPVALISLASLADATYVTALAFSDEAVVCGGSPDCFKAVQPLYISEPFRSRARPRLLSSAF